MIYLLLHASGVRSPAISPWGIVTGTIVWPISVQVCKIGWQASNLPGYAKDLPSQDFRFHVEIWHQKMSLICDRSPLALTVTLMHAFPSLPDNRLQQCRIANHSMGSSWSSRSQEVAVKWKPNYGNYFWNRIIQKSRVFGIEWQFPVEYWRWRAGRLAKSQVSLHP